MDQENECLDRDKRLKDSNFERLIEGQAINFKDFKPLDDHRKVGRMVGKCTNLDL